MGHRRRGLGAPPLGAVPPARGGVVRLTTGRWAVERWQGAAADAHHDRWPLQPVPSVRVVEATTLALVLGSTQPAHVVDARAAAAAGVAVVRRRSGGGAVLVGPGEILWVDLFVPADDPLWEPDVGLATHWVGRAWTAAFAAAGREAAWYDGPLVSTPWSALVCFAGLGPGEVRVGAAKVVGISQRRTRAGALFQCAALQRWAPERIVSLLDLDGADRDRAGVDLATVAAPVGVDRSALEAALLDELAGV